MADNENKKRISRRDFTKIAALGIGGPCLLPVAGPGTGRGRYHRYICRHIPGDAELHYQINTREMDDQRLPPIIIRNGRAAKERRGIEFMFNTRGQRLITDAAGAVIGIQAHTGVKWVNSDYTGGSPVNIKTRNGVILTSGGFE